MRTRSLLALCLGGTALAASAPAQANTCTDVSISNAGFEDDPSNCVDVGIVTYCLGAPTGWTKAGTANVGTVSGDASYLESYEGDNAAATNGNYASGTTLSRTLTSVTAGMAYEVCIQVGYRVNLSSEPPFFLSLEVDGVEVDAEDTSTTTLTHGDWTQVCLSHTATTAEDGADLTMILGTDVSTAGSQTLWDDLTAQACTASTDGDGVCDATDVVDTDADGSADDCDSHPNDYDNDGVDTASDCDDADVSVGSATSWYADADGDGLGDPSTSVSACDAPTGYVADSSDLSDADFDNDGYDDDVDAFPADSSEWLDTDSDGVGDNSDLFPADSSEWADTDGDGVGDNADLFPTDPNETGDADGDGVGDNSDSCTGFPNTDTDSDGVCDDSDVCPTDPDDLDDDNDGVCDVVDVCVGVDNVDADGDQICDDLDVCEGNDASGDQDADGYCDSDDNCPADANASQTDTDGDDIGDACEADTDADGVIDDDDNCVDDANADQSDLDEDGDGDVCDDDDDNDGVTDASDNCPFYANASQTDTDGDGYGDVCDGDDDGDGVADDADSCPGTPLDAPFNSMGCSGAQAVELSCGEPDDYGWSRRSRYIRCVTREARSAWRQGLLTRREAAHMTRRAVWAVWLGYFSKLRRWC